jgi:GT2 family glycosyltransferase
MTEKEDLTAIIPNWNGAIDTLELVDSLISDSKDDINLEIVIIDNSSEISDYERLKKGLEKIKTTIKYKLIRNQQNIGIPAAYNQAIKNRGLKNSHILRLDNDVVVLRGCLTRLLDALKQNKEDGISIVGCNTKLYDNTAENNAGAYSINLVRGINKVDYPVKSKVCDGVLGCIMLIDNEITEIFQPNIFNPWLFISADESELSLRCRNIGRKTYYIHETLALHKSGRSTGRVSNLSEYYNVRNWAYLCLEYENNFILRIVILLRLILSIVYFRIKNKNNKMNASIQGIKKYFSKII